VEKILSWGTSEIRMEEVGILVPVFDCIDDETDSMQFNLFIYMSLFKKLPVFQKPRFFLLLESHFYLIPS